MIRFLLLFILLSPAWLAAQTPQGLSYQAILRNSQGEPLASQTVTLRFTVLDGGAAGMPVFIETHGAQTNTYGLVSLAIGAGTAELGSLAMVDWSSGNKYLKVELAPDGSSFLLQGVSPLLTVPYAFYAERTGLEAGPGISVVDGIVSNTAPDLPVNITGAGATSVSGAYPNFTITSTDQNTTYTSGAGIAINGSFIENTGDLDPTNELQSLALSGHTLSITDGNSIELPELAAGPGISLDNGTVANAGDLDSTNELQTLILTGSTLGITGGNTVNIDPSPTNEIQSLTLAGNTLGITFGNTVTVDPSTTNELQTLNLSGNTLSLSPSGGSVTLPAATASPWLIGGTSVYYSAGNVGIGTTSPAEKLHLAGRMKIDAANTLEFGAGVSGKQTDAGKIGYQFLSTDALDIVGAGSGTLNRRIKFWSNGGASFTGKLDIGGNLKLATASIPMGITSELSGTGPLLNFDVNFRGPDRDDTVLGGAFRIDARPNSQLFQWFYRAPNTTSDVAVMTLEKDGRLIVNGLVQAASLKLSSGAGAGKVLTSDASGNATWQTATGGSGQWTAVGSNLQYTAGKVLIGNVTTPGSYKLYVEQGILTERLKVAVKSTSYWADYVFAPGYRPMPLEEVGRFVSKYRHLPGVPSAEEMVEQGLDVAAMDAKLLEKIEELTLYLIDLKKENDALRQRVEQLEHKKQMEK